VIIGTPPYCSTGKKRSSAMSAANNSAAWMSSGTRWKFAMMVAGKSPSATLARITLTMTRRPLDARFPVAHAPLDANPVLPFHDFARFALRDSILTAFVK
jgi:hypothetical protein